MRIGRSDLVLRPPKMEPFKVLPVSSVKWPISMVATLDDPMEIALPIPCEWDYYLTMVVKGNEERERDVVTILVDSRASLRRWGTPVHSKQ